ncbi:ABC transporter permease [Stenotrophomonas geniculata]|uniref:ABC transporter permease n=1 Tax=Stenotrophomonas geniculata TaxID=86188 RepID=UPI00294A2D8C|nr:ABC transporter permease [Stenotrophomonas geniculata]MDV6188725.1 ABC transporter permease [Stenotrophomonas geniculata]
MFNSNQAMSMAPITALRSIFHYRTLILEMVKREVIGRYRGSVMGLLWSFFTPVLMLVVYTFVFSVVFRARWAGGSGSKTEFAVVLFVGMMIFGLFSECINRAPSLILSNANYVKKVIFPLEILPVVSLGAALFHFAISMVVWVLFYLILFGIPSIQALWLPIVMVPLLILCVGVSWFLASLGVYLRDVGQVIVVVTTALMFMSPVFFPAVAMPEEFRPYLYISPITYFIEQSRELLIWHGGMHWGMWLKMMGVSIAVAVLGFAWFQKTRKGFADVI